jgi:putative toxin-antitoxin system antitoxin component (TIGR02293 family)
MTRTSRPTTPLLEYADPNELPASETSRVAMLLAIDEANIVTDVQLARIVSNGLHPQSATALAKVLGRNRVVGPVVPEATLRRVTKARKALSRQLSERLYEVGRVVDAASRAYHGDWDAIDAFLNRPHPLLEGETPFDMARSNSAGTEAVLNLIRRAVAGVAL